jgi:hypothetical protein
LEIGRRAAAPGAIVMEAAGNFTAPFRLDSQISFDRSGGPARGVRARRLAKRGVAKAAHFGGVAIHGATLLTGFYHRSVLRCGRLAERKSGVADILSVPHRR